MKAQSAAPPTPSRGCSDSGWRVGGTRQGFAGAPAGPGQDGSPLLKKALTMKLKETEAAAKHSRKTSTSEGSL